MQAASPADKRLPSSSALLEHFFRLTGDAEVMACPSFPSFETTLQVFLSLVTLTLQGFCTFFPPFETTLQGFRTSFSLLSLSL